MTYEEAKTCKQHLELLKAEIELDKPIEYQLDLDLAIEALEKQIPKKPKMTLHNGYCGNCKVSWGYDRLKIEEYCGFKYFQYCPTCGQRIDWM